MKFWRRQSAAWVVFTGNILLQFRNQWHWYSVGEKSESTWLHASSQQRDRSRLSGKESSLSPRRTPPPHTSGILLTARHSQMKADLGKQLKFSPGITPQRPPSDRTSPCDRVIEASGHAEAHYPPHQRDQMEEASERKRANYNNATSFFVSKEAIQKCIIQSKWVV